MKNNKLLFYVLSFTWGLPMTLVGVVAAAVMLLLFRKPELCGYCIRFRIGNVCNGFVVFSLILGTLAAIDGAISKLNYVSRITNKIAYKASAKAMDKEKEKNKQKFNDVISFDDFIAK